MRAPKKVLITCFVVAIVSIQAFFGFVPSPPLQADFGLPDIMPPGLIPGPTLKRSRNKRSEASHIACSFLCEFLFWLLPELASSHLSMCRRLRHRKRNGAQAVVPFCVLIGIIVVIVMIAIMLIIVILAILGRIVIIVVIIVPCKLFLLKPVVDVTARPWSSCKL